MRLRGSVQDVTDQREAERALAGRGRARGRRRERRSPTSCSAACCPQRSFDAEQLEVAAYYRAGVAGTQVGGDWYDVIDVGAGRTALVLGDVVGRGVRAAAVMGQLRAAVRAYAQLELSPADVLECLDEVVRQLGPEQLVTCLYAVFDPRDRVAHLRQRRAISRRCWRARARRRSGSTAPSARRSAPARPASASDARRWSRARCSRSTPTGSSSGAAA